MLCILCGIFSFSLLSQTHPRSTEYCCRCNITQLHAFVLFPCSPGTTVHHHTSHVSVTHSHQTRLGITGLDTIVHTLIERGIARSTLAVYESGKKRYMEFCSHLNLPPLPVNEPTLLQFVAHLFSVSQTIRSYLSAVRHLQIVNGLPDPAMESFPRLTYALKGVRRERPIAQRQTRLPITPELLRKIHHRWIQEPQDFDRTMLWAAFCLGFFGFMRSGEFTCPSTNSFSPDMLTHHDIAMT